MRKDYKLEKRKYVIIAFLFVIAAIYLVRLFNLQVIDNKYKDVADSNAYLKKAIYPSRGLIYDRNDSLIVFNNPTYDIMLVPRDVQEFDTADFCNTLNITRDELIKRFADMRDKKINPNYSAYTPQKLLSHLSQEDYGRLQEKLHRFSGFYIQKRILRQYACNVGANILGNIREVSQKDIERDEYYSPGDYCGDLGIERSYESILRGEKGQEILIRDAVGKIQGKFDNGSHDKRPIPGKNLKLSIDVKLQEYGERLMAGKVGAVVAIEPETGEILALVSSPSYDPNLLVGRERGKNYSKLVTDPHKPLFDRALMGAYPPGSTFKPSQGLILRQEGIVSLTTAYPCHRGFISGGLRVGCHGHESPITLKPALRTSCNAYFCWGLKSLLENHKKKYGTIENAFETWKNHLVSLGYGYKLGVDLPGESRGFIPNSKYYNSAYGENHWSANTIISIAIGQGEILATPLQIANLAATIANRGWFITPHVVKEIQDTVLPKEYTEKRIPKIKQQYFDEVAEGMRMAVLGGTCTKANMRDFEVCGKTGTAENPHGRDHSAFIGFAPYHEPKIAVCAYIENGGFGATYGVPIGSLMMEKYLRGYISPERKGLEASMLHARTVK
ncbi:MAG: penicillin-binding protein 2 [Muribaculaceae bacterium]|nr:penicillin-binding protein 2 [Muribaculaceae bacterium]